MAATNGPKSPDGVRSSTPSPEERGGYWSAAGFGLQATVNMFIFLPAASLGWPWWMICLSTAAVAFPLFWGLRNLARAGRLTRARRRRRDGQCLACGYDLRESPERCPECGVVPEGDKHPV